MIRKLLVPVRGDGKGDNVLAHAAALARRYKAHVEILHSRARPEDWIPYGVHVPAFLKKQMLEQAAQVADSEEAGMRDELRVLAEKLNLDLDGAPEGQTATASWLEDKGRQVDTIRRHGRLADLICVAKPDVDRNLGHNTLKAALFHSGRPVMMCPPTDKVSDTLGSHVAIAWNGSSEAARAVALTPGLIEGADKVSILTAGEEIHGASAEDLVKYLHIRGVTATVERFEKSRNIGRDLLAHCANLGADLMIMGAYSESHEKETLLGGNTQTIVDTAKMPVVMVH
ncbi:universal stress protein [Palleronia sediminis]|uniref:Universal stress protein n=1 Tax=Palleronia sediminis TaxID=2547833 RepID=A0A4R6ADZ3_9RHOB|nr:universal stress protein [Palleronia sediminis]TDL81154.1 universal stress protein [Palleronia sediminis]